MNEIKKCSLSGIGFTLEREAYNRLNNYLQSLKEAYKSSADCDEILADIEARIAELILSAQSSAENVVCLPLVENIIAQLGSPEAISGEESAPAEEPSRIPRRLYRDLENSKLGGVCAGLAKHFGVETVWIRLAIFSPLLLLFLSGIPHMSWCAQVGGNLFAIFLLTYLILWFAIPAAKSARQKLEQEGERISAQSIAERQGATQEERAKSSIATAVTALGRFAAIVLKIFLGLMLFPIFGFIISLLIAIAWIFTDTQLITLNIGNIDTLAQALGEFGTPLMVFSILLLLVPAVYIAYLFITLLLNKRVRWRGLLITFFVWLALLFTTALCGIAYAERESFRFFSSDSEVERIMKNSEQTSLSRQIMEALDEEMDDEQRQEFERLLHDKNVQSIDK